MDENDRKDIREILNRTLDAEGCPVELDGPTKNEIIDLCISEMYSRDRASFEKRIQKLVKQAVVNHFLKEG